MPDTELLGNQNEEKKVKIPWLPVAPAVEDPPGDHEVQEEVNNLDDVHPLDAMPRARLQHFADAPEHACHTQRQNDGDKNERYSNAPIC